MIHYKVQNYIFSVKFNIIEGQNLYKISLNNTFYSYYMPVAVYDGCSIVAFVYRLRLKQYL